MKVTLTFEGRGADYKYEINNILHASKMVSFIHAVEQLLRDKAKHSDDPPSWYAIKDAYYDLKKGYDLPEFD